jgi:hypothetical protein
MHCWERSELCDTPRRFRWRSEVKRVQRAISRWRKSGSRRLTCSTRWSRRENWRPRKSSPLSSRSVVRGIYIFSFPPPLLRLNNNSHRTNKGLIFVFIPFVKRMTPSQCHALSFYPLLLTWKKITRKKSLHLLSTFFYKFYNFSNSVSLSKHNFWG